MDALADASALFNVAYQVIVQGDGEHGESSVLRIAVEKLDRLADQLYDAENQLARLRKKLQP